MKKSIKTDIKEVMEGEKMGLNLEKEKKKKMIIMIGIIVTVFIITSIGFYIGNRNFRTFFDRYILRKEITENKATSINIQEEENPSIYAYDKYITILNKNKLNLYNSSRKKRTRIRN